jgi:hypothetical protein
MAEQSDDRGILTPADRAYLTGESEMKSEQSERNTRFRIRNRIQRAIQDFDIILSNLDEKDRQNVFEKLLTIDGEPIELTTSHELVQTLTFLYEGIEEQEYEFEEVIELAIEHSETRQGRVVKDVDVEITVESEQPDVNELINRLRAGENLSDSELDILVRQSDFEDLKTLIREGIIEGDIHPAEETESDSAGD